MQTNAPRGQPVRSLNMNLSSQMVLPTALAPLVRLGSTQVPKQQCVLSGRYRAYPIRLNGRLILHMIVNVGVARACVTMELGRGVRYRVYVKSAIRGTI
jgi:hypothetical protein